MEIFQKIVSGWKSLTVFAKWSILDASVDPEYGSGFH